MSRVETVKVKTRKIAIKQMPWASWIVKVQGGFRGFEYASDYLLFVEKYNKRHEIKGHKYLGHSV